MDSAVPSTGDAAPTAATVVRHDARSDWLTPGARTIPDHQLLHAIAAGAYGEVWLARNAVGTFRAVKIVRRDRHTSAESFEREFKGLQKFEPVSRAHVGLVDILTLGLLPDGAGFYYVMELADQAVVAAGVPPAGEGGILPPGSRPRSSSGSPAHTPVPPDETPDSTAGEDACRYEPRTLRAELKSRGALPADEVIAHGLKLTAALAHLHAEGLVHRDVKPSNILSIGGEPKLADAGLVAAVDDARSLVGTAGYIAPEGPGTPQADLYALGKVLYEAAFGKDRQEFPALPADVASRPDHAQLLELNAILLKACATDQRERYQSADQMCGELEFLYAGRSVKRRQTWQRGWIHAKRLGLAVAALAVVSAITYWLSTTRQSSPTNSTQSSPPDLLTSTNELALEEYRRGLDFLHADNGVQAIRHFDRAVELDPNFAEAWARKAWTYYTEGGVTNGLKGAAAAEKAVSLNPNLAYAHSMLASAKMGELNWAEAEKERNLAVTLNPNSQEILLESALNLALMGKTNEALVDLEKARRANPDSPSNIREGQYGFVYAWCRQFDRALKIFNRINPIPKGGHFFFTAQHAQAYLAIGDYTNSMRFAKQAALARGEEQDRVNREFDALNKALTEEGQHRYWEVMLEFETSKQDPNHLMRMAAIHARLNQPEEAFKYLKQARQDTPLDFNAGLNTNPSFDSLRKDERFQKMIDELWGKK